jgi:hypothetical protein
MPARLFLSLAFFLTVHAASAAQDEWAASRIDPSSVPLEIVEEKRELAPGGLPDGHVETFDGEGDISAAWYASPTERYGHGVIGDAVEGGALVARTAAGEELVFELPETEVFEDRYPRLADLDGDGTVEVVTIRSSIRLGASVTVYGIDEGRLVEKASTGFIGLANRWLNIAGIAGFRGGAGKEIAFVEKPHIGGTLFVYGYKNKALTPVASMPGFSNHLIGAAELRLSALADVNGDGGVDLALPSFDRQSLRIVGFANGAFVEIASVALPSRIDKAIGVRGVGRDTSFLVGLQNAEVYEVRRR